MMFSALSMHKQGENMTIFLPQQVKNLCNNLALENYTKGISKAEHQTRVPMQNQVSQYQDFFMTKVSKMGGDHSVLVPTDQTHWDIRHRYHAWPNQLVAAKSF